MKKLREIYPVETITVIFFGPDPTAKEPTAVLVKVEDRDGTEIHDLTENIKHLERAIDSLSDWLEMYRRWAEQDEIVRLAQDDAH